MIELGYVRGENMKNKRRLVYKLASFFVLAKNLRKKK